MKRKIITSLIVMFASFGIALAATYHYAFILSCGQTIYRSFDHSLSDAELLQWTDFFEETLCQTLRPVMPAV